MPSPRSLRLSIIPARWAVFQAAAIAVLLCRVSHADNPSMEIKAPAGLGPVRAAAVQSRAGAPRLQAPAAEAAPEEAPAEPAAPPAAVAPAAPAPAKTEVAPKAAAPAAAAQPRGAELAGIDSSTPKALAALPTGADKSGVTSKSISMPQGAGKIDGMGESFSAQLSTGIATFSVPFALPGARGGAQPSLGLSYSSSGGAGTAGQGWSVGVPFIARQTDRGVPRYKDGYGFQPDQDRFVFNGGQELVPVCLVGGNGGGLSCAGALPNEAMPSWSSGWMAFRPRVEGSFLRFFWSPDHRTWRIQDKSGIQMELGVPLDGSETTEALEVNPTDSTEIFRWHLIRQYDSYGAVNDAAGVHPNNQVLYRYLQDGGSAYLSDIYDTSPASDPASSSLDKFAHHTHLEYEPRTDPTHSYRSGWRMDQRLRLASVAVASKVFGSAGMDPIASPRKVVRNYFLSYDANLHSSQLVSVQVEGRCAGTESAAADEGALGSCGRLPAMTFEYSHVAPFKTTGTPGVADIAGYEGFDERIQSITGSPDHSLDEALTGLFDINSDSLPDVLVTAPGTYGSGHGVFFSSPGGKANSFAAARIMQVKGGLDDGANVIKLSNLNVTPLDLDGDATIDLLHMPKVKTYSVYTPGRSGADWFWQGRPITTANQQNAAIDFGKDTTDLQVMDVNFDGLVDVVRTTGTEIQTYLSLGRLPNGDGQFGQGHWTGAVTSALSNDPIRTCVPWSGNPVRFSDPDVKLADLNGDGISDIVRLRRGAVLYWPGRGNGVWGTGERGDCPAGTFSDRRHVEMASSPQWSDIEGTTLRLDDVNGDGLDDLVQVRFQAVDVWLNVDGVGWTERHVIEGTPAAPSYASRYELADINGSGTRDILWGDGNAYKYIDLQGGKAPGLLVGVANGLGKRTTIEYSTSTQEMLGADGQTACDPTVPADVAAAERDPWSHAWCTKMPSVIPVVKAIHESDQLGSTYTTEYAYRDPVFEGRQREFRGFRHARATRVGDANSPTDITDSTFLLGECVDPNPSDGDDCAPPGRWVDNPREALKGLPVMTEKRSATGTVLSTSATSYELRELYVGLDGRRVMHAVATGSDNYIYDTALPPTGTETVTHPSVSYTSLTGGLGTPNPLLPVPSVSTVVTVRSTHGVAHTRSSSSIDAFGNQTTSVAQGCVGGDACVSPTGAADVDGTIVSITTPCRRGDDPTGWMWRTCESLVTGETGGPRKHTQVAYDLHGAPTKTSAYLSGSGQLDRFRSSGSGAAAPSPSGISEDKADAIVLATTEYDAAGLGTVVKETGANGRCRTVTYDAAGYGMLPVVETLYTGAGCTGMALSATVGQYDRGFGAIVVASNLQMQPSRVEYDQFGRLSKMWSAHPNPTGLELEATLSPLPSVEVEYQLATSTRPWSVIHTRTQDAKELTSPEYMDAFAFVDGLGRARATFTEADPTSGPGAGNDDGHWVVSGLVDYDAKGAARRKYLEFFSDSDPATVSLPIIPLTRYGSQRYDAFGRSIQTYDIDGTMTLQSVYHALCTDLYDAADLEPGPHQGTYASTCQDGHGRGVLSTERVHVGNTVDTRHVLTKYLATGEPAVITRANGNLSGGGTGTVTRWMRYDSLGRMVLNVEPNTSVNFTADSNVSATPTGQAGTGLKAWRYVYNDAGDLLGTSDARGCGVNYAYDAAGRILSEDYSPCEASHAAYTTGAEIAYYYDSTDGLPVAPPSGFGSAQGRFNIGRAVATFDRGSASFTAYDGRGRVVAAATQVVKADAQASTSFAQRYAPRVYRQDFAFDAADREISATTGAQVPSLLAAGKSAVTTEYSARGSVKRVSSSYGDLVKEIHRTADGRVTQVRYGDLAGTTTETNYDDRRRARNVTTFRGPPAAWTSSVPAYQPAPAYSPDLTQLSTFQLLLQDEEYSYDVVGNPTEIRDYRIPEEWPATAKPVTRKMEYDDLYRVKRMEYEYSGGADTWRSPYASEIDDRANTPSGQAPKARDNRRALPSAQVLYAQRVQVQTFDYDWLGNTVKTGDDANGFYDRSLGSITNSATKPYQLTGTDDLAGTFGGKLAAQYDAAGNLTRLNVMRRGTCSVQGQCSHRFAYDWDEVGRLVRARRWDRDAAGFDVTNLGDLSGNLAADLQYLYDAGDQRVLKTAVDGSNNKRYTVYALGSLELRRANWIQSGSVSDYELTNLTEVPYLFAHGVRLGRVVWNQASDGVPEVSTDALTTVGQHVLLELGDHLGSTNAVVDYATGELVELSAFYGYGATESDYRPGRWAGFREDYRFTGKEEDVEVGLTYFGKRFLNAYLGRWMSADPLAVHAPGEADLNLYAYVSGKVLQATDPAGLQEAAAPDLRAGETYDSESKTISGGSIRVTIEFDEPSPGAAGAAPAGNGVDKSMQAFAAGVMERVDTRALGIGRFYEGAAKGTASAVVGGLRDLAMMCLPFGNLYVAKQTGDSVGNWLTGGGPGQLWADLAAGPTPENGERVGALLGPALFLHPFGGMELPKLPKLRLKETFLPLQIDVGLSSSMGVGMIGVRRRGVGNAARELSRGDLFELTVKRTFRKKILRENEELYNSAGKKVGQIDFETSEAIVEVGVSLHGKMDQLHKLAEVAASRGKRLDVIYGPDTHPFTVRDFARSLKGKFGNRVRFIPHLEVE